MQSVRPALWQVLQLVVLYSTQDCHNLYYISSNIFKGTDYLVNLSLQSHPVFLYSRVASSTFLSQSPLMWFLQALLLESLVKQSFCTLQEWSKDCRVNDACHCIFTLTKIVEMMFHIVIMILPGNIWHQNSSTCYIC